MKIMQETTTNATPEGFPRRGGQGLSAAKAIRYAANTPPAKDKTPRPVEDLMTKNIARKQARGFAMLPSTTER